ncbi:MAG: hypothetical protein QXE05_05675 [Nitrososphaeria archaeon]
MKNEVELVEEISKDLKDFEALLKGKWKFNAPPEELKIDLPKGIFDTADDKRKELVFIENEVIKTNVSYHLMLLDFYEWLLNRFKIGLTFREMLIKESICLIGNICAALVKKLPGIDGKGVKPCFDKLKNKGVIDDKLREDLIWIWNTRNKEHIENLPEREYRKYNEGNYKKAREALSSLINALNKGFGK